ncbi:MAG: ArsR/SmtB family transcription factor, partial [Gammaproteobacteria bacterium]
RGLALLESLGVDTSRFCERRYSRVCRVDWSERREHLAGPLGNAIHKRLLELGWVRSHLDSRAISVTKAGKKGFQSTFGIDVSAIL